MSKGSNPITGAFAKLGTTWPNTRDVLPSFDSLRQPFGLTRVHDSPFGVVGFIPFGPQTGQHSSQ